jgi:hypothetical protein
MMDGIIASCLLEDTRELDPIYIRLVEDASFFVGSIWFEIPGFKKLLGNVYVGDTCDFS